MKKMIINPFLNDKIPKPGEWAICYSKYSISKDKFRI
jgi:hypothetical protein